MIIIELEEEQNDNITAISEKAMEAESPQNPEIKEGFGLLGEVHYEDIGNGRLKCLETGHELLLKDADSYGKSKKCRLALIDRALQIKRAPLNSFEQSPLDRCKLICKLTGDTINKTEEHIWKHLSGRKFQNKLAQKESEKNLSKGEKSENGPETKKIRTKVKKKKKVEMGNINSDLNADADSKSESEEPDFWIPPVGSRWDYDDGRDRWEDHRRSKERQKKGEKSGSKNSIVEEGASVAEDITIRTKRMSISVGPSNFASQKKKLKLTDQLVKETPVEDQVL